LSVDRRERWMTHHQKISFSEPGGGRKIAAASGLGEPSDARVTTQKLVLDAAAARHSGN